MSRRRRTTILAGAVCASLVALVFAGAASAQIVNLRAYNGPYPGGSFDGTGSVGPGGAPFSGIHQMDINQVNGDFIVGNNNYWYKFNSAGAPSAFSALGTTTMVGPTGQSNWADVAVDNSGGAGGVGEGEQGRIYGMSEYEGSIRGWKANGEPVSGGFAPPGGLGYGGLCGFDTDSEGDVWAGSWTGGADLGVQPGRNADRGIVQQRQSRSAAWRSTMPATSTSSTTAAAASGNSAPPVKTSG